VKKPAVKKRAKKTDDGFWFDEVAAERACAFFPRFLRHIKGQWSGQPFDLEPWQKEIIRAVFGWKRPDGTRRYRTVYIEIPRKNGKSAICAGLALFLLFADNEPGAEIYSAAGDREQAAIVFDVAKEMREASSALVSRSEAYRRSIVFPSLSADAPTKHGLNAHGILFDELHVQPDRELWDTLTTSMGARRQPLTIAVTTAGYDRNSICWEQHDYALKVKKGIIQDPSFLPVIYAADEEDDWTSPETWKKANPNMGVSVSESYLDQECKRAQEVAAYENTFKRLHLNLWTKQSKRWLVIEKWDASGDAGGRIDEDDLAGMPCYAALDLATTTDIAAFVLVFQVEGAFKVLCRFFVPEDTIDERSRQASDMYRLWAKQGFITATEGDQIDYRTIYTQIKADAERFEIKELAFDRWGATQMVQDLTADGLKVVPIGQGFASMSAPTKELIRLVLSKKIHHGGHPVLRWMADNMACKQDAAGNIKPDKEKSTEKIDGMVALVMALARIIVTPEGGDRSVYEDRGPIVI
jgi:phage terminase large subunit-like protein